MKKIVALPLMAALAFSATACTKNAPGDNVSETTLNESVTENVSATDDFTSGNASVGNDADIDSTSKTAVTNAQ